MITTDFIRDGMVIDPAILQEIVGRAVASNFGDYPDQAANFLGNIGLPDGRVVGSFVRHAVDGIIHDPFDHVVLITRTYNPGVGLKALPGGLIDPIQKIDGRMVAEKALIATFREATQETNISERVLRNARVIPLGHRLFERPFDVRVAWRDMEGTDIKKGDLVLISTQGFSVMTQEDLSKIPLKAGDDADAAAGVHVDKISELKPEQFGIADHLPMIRAAKLAAGWFSLS